MGMFKLGNDNLIWVSATQTGTYTLPAGQQDGKLTYKRSSADASTKDSGGFALKVPGLWEVALTLNMIPLLPDANGYTLMETTAFAYPATPLYIKLRKGGVAATDSGTLFGAAFWISSLDWDDAQNNVFKTPFSFDLAGQPFVLPVLS